MITNSIEWASVETALLRRAAKLSNGKDISKMIRNLNIEVTNLSRAEVGLRQGNRNHAEECLKKVNADIEMIEEYLLIAVLMG